MFFPIYLFILLNVNLPEDVESKNVKHFICDKNNIDEIKNLKTNLKRVFRHNNKIYFVLNKRVIFTNLFVRTENEQNLYQEFSFLYQNFYEQEHVEETKVFNSTDWRVFGYLNEQNSDKTYEFYKNDTLALFPSAYELDLNETLAKRKNLVKTNDVLGDLKADFDRILKNRTKIEKINMIVHKKVEDEVNKKIKIKQFISYITELVKFNRKTSVAVVEFINFKNNQFELIQPLSVSIKFSISYMNEDTLNDKRGNSYTHLFIETQDQKDFQFKYIYAHFAYNRSLDSSSALHDYTFQHKITFEELFSCPFMSDKNQIKGILLNRERNMFFIFINRFYLGIKSEIILSKFYIPDNAFDEHAYEINYENEENYEQAKFNNLNKNYLKLFRNQIYFRPNIDPYTLNTDRIDKLTVNKLPKDQNVKIGKCFHSTLEIGTSLYCFDEKIYYLMRNGIKLEIDSIKYIFDIFEAWNEELFLIFNNDNKSVIFMTQTELFVLNYDLFKIESNYKLRYSSHLQIRFPNCIFNKQLCNLKPDSGDKVPKREEPNDEKSNFFKKFFKANRVYIYIALAFLSIAFIICICVCCRSNSTESSKTSIKTRLSSGAVDWEPTRNQTPQFLKTPSSKSNKSTKSTKSNKSTKSTKSTRSVKNVKPKSTRLKSLTLNSTTSMGSQPSIRSATILKSNRSLTLTGSYPSAGSVVSTSPSSSKFSRTVGSSRSIVSNITRSGMNSKSNLSSSLKSKRNILNAKKRFKKKSRK